MEEVYCEFKYSRVAAAFLALAAGLTLALVACVPLAGALKALVGAGVVALAAHAYGRLGRVAALRLSASRALAVRARSGAWTEGRLRDGAFVAPWLTILRWRAEGARFDRTLVILPDMADADARRRVRVIARWA